MPARKPYRACATFTITVHGASYRASFSKELALLLDIVKERNSISAAAEVAGLAYSSAWHMVNSTEKALGCRLVERSKGSKSRLSRSGLRLLKLWHEIDDECQALATLRLEEKLQESSGRAWRKDRDNASNNVSKASKVDKVQPIKD
ncbi:MAG: LysR family transcriptional regulator [Coriobacteriales bacterium]|jgi:molybdate transport repressor ModE-like protein|nr:LysR family transcriptional regulator [Coriobacteriales bacterium]